MLIVHVISGAHSFGLILEEERTVAEVVVVTAVVRQEVHRVLLHNVFGVLGYEICAR
jgi:hypothetical protein